IPAVVHLGISFSGTFRPPPGRARGARTRPAGGRPRAVGGATPGRAGRQNGPPAPPARPPPPGPRPPRPPRQPGALGPVLAASLSLVTRSRYSLSRSCRSGLLASAAVLWASTRPSSLTISTSVDALSSTRFASGRPPGPAGRL